MPAGVHQKHAHAVLGEPFSGQQPGGARAYHEYVGRSCRHAQASALSAIHCRASAARCVIS